MYRGYKRIMEKRMEATSYVTLTGEQPSVDQTIASEHNYQCCPLTGAIALTPSVTTTITAPPHWRSLLQLPQSLLVQDWKHLQSPLSG